MSVGTRDVVIDLGVRAQLNRLLGISGYRRQYSHIESAAQVSSKLSATNGLDQLGFDSQASSP